VRIADSGANHSQPEKVSLPYLMEFCPGDEKQRVSEFEKKSGLNVETILNGYALENTPIGDQSNPAVHAIEYFARRILNIASIIICETAPPTDPAVDPHDETPEQGKDDRECNRDKEDRPDGHICRI